MSKFSPHAEIHTYSWPVRLLLYAYGLLLTPPILLILALVRLSCRVVIKGQERIPSDSGCIFASWHQYFVLYICGALPFRKHAWLHHDGAYLAPGILVLHLIGVTRCIAVPSRGSRQEAIDRLVEALREGHSTYITPDGPFGPFKQAKPGAFLLAQRSGCPIIGVRLRCSRAWSFPSSDRKLIPLPGSTITLEFTEPLWVEGDWEDFRVRLESRLTSPTRASS